MSPVPKNRRPAPRTGKSSRAKGRRPAVRAARRTRTSTVWYALTAVIVIIGVTLVVVSRPNDSAAAGIRLGNHWHAALGVYACDHWDGGSG